MIYVQTLILDGLAVIFLVSGVAKVLGLRAFREALLHIPYMPVIATCVVGYALPFVELAVAIGLFANSVWARLAAILLLGLFCAAATLAILHRVRVPCNCFGPTGSDTLGSATIRRNLLLVGLTVATFGLGRRLPLPLPAFAAASLLVILLCLSQAFGNLRLARAFSGARVS